MAENIPLFQMLLTSFAFCNEHMEKSTFVHFRGYFRHHSHIFVSTKASTYIIYKCNKNVCINSVYRMVKMRGGGELG
jgi:hypothetical protein